MKYQRVVVGFGIIFFILMTVITTTWAIDDLRPRLAVVRFENRAQSMWQLPEVALAIQDLAIEELLATGAVRVFEREEIDAILAEHDLAFQGLIDPQTAVEFGKMIGVELLLVGRIESIDLREAGGGVSLPIRTPLGGVRVSQRTRQASVNLNLRLIDVTSGEILFSRTSGGDSGKTTTRITVGWFTERIQGGEHILEAAQNAMEPMISEVVMAASAVPVARVDTTRYIVRVDGREVLTDLGVQSGIRVGDRIVIYREDEEIVHPVSGEVLGVETRDLAVAYISEVQEKMSRAVVMEWFEDTSILVGDRVRLEH